MMLAVDFARLVEESGLVPTARVTATLASLDGAQPTAEFLALRLVEAALLTRWQAKEIANGRGRYLTVANRYQVCERIAMGGIGSVYRAVDIQTHEEVVLKVPRRETIASPNMVARFRREVQTCCKLRHPNIVRALSGGVVGGIPYLVLELIEGSDLASLLVSQGPFPAPEAVEYLLGATQALAYINRRGIVHRDLKPANLMRARDGRLKLLDLGMARLMDEADRSLDAATTWEEPLSMAGGYLVGSAIYMAPEQIQDPRSADIRSDIYSLGCTFHELVSGQPPLLGPTPLATYLRRENEPLPLLPNVDGELQAIAHKMLAWSPARRFQSPDELLEALRTWQLENFATKMMQDSVY